MLRRIIVVLMLFGTVVGAQDAGSLSDEFYAAIRVNDLAHLEKLLKSGANPNVPDPRGGATPLMYAAAAGSLEAMRLLLDNGATVNATSSAGSTALIWAVTDAEKVRLLLARGADAKAASQRGRTALVVAARGDGSAAVVKMLIAAGADPKAVDAFKTTTLNAATFGNDIDTIRLMVDAGVDINAADFAGFTPLINAAANRNLEAVKLLLSKGRRRERAVRRRLLPEGESRNDCARIFHASHSGGRVRRSGSHQDAARRRSQGRCPGCPRHDPADACGGQRPPAHRRCPHADCRRRRRECQEHRRRNSARLGAEKWLPGRD